MTFCKFRHIMISKNIIKFIRSLELKKNRKAEGLFVAEGPKVVGELMRHNAPATIIATDEWIKDNNPNCENIIKVDEDELRKVSFLQHPQQVLALFPVPKKENIISADSLSPDKLYIALDGVQDPGNVGTIIRIADWFGIDTIICSLDTADAYNPKVVQATMGSIAGINIIYTDLKKALHQLGENMPIYGTLLNGKNIYEERLSANGVIVFGNEGKGISPAIRELINREILIPCMNDNCSAESLNVAIATAITCSEFRRR